jgi:hypothetical protein
MFVLYKILSNRKQFFDDFSKIKWETEIVFKKLGQKK